MWEEILLPEKGVISYPDNIVIGNSQLTLLRFRDIIVEEENLNTKFVRREIKPMKIRLVRNAEQKLQVLYSDGTIARATPALLSDLLIGFNRQSSIFCGGDAGIWNKECFDMSDYPGETCAYLADNDMLVVVDGSAFKAITKTQMVSLISIAEFAEKHNRSAEMIKVFCRNGRIPGAKKIGKTWMVPENAEYPVDVVNQRAPLRRPSTASAAAASSEKSDDSKSNK